MNNVIKLFDYKKYFNKIKLKRKYNIFENYKIKFLNKNEK